MRALFVWEAPPPPPPPLTLREVFLLVDVDMGVWSGTDPDCVLGREIAAVLARRDALEEAKKAPFVSQPEIQVEGHRDGLSWGYVDVPPDASAWRVLMTSEPVPVGREPVSLFAPVAVFQHHRFHGTGAAIFVRDGLDVERVSALLRTLARAA